MRSQLTRSKQSLLIDIDGYLSIQPRKVVAVKEHEGGDTCSIFFAGQSPSIGEGFLVKRPAEDVVADINKALEDLEEEY